MTIITSTDQVIRQPTGAILVWLGDTGTPIQFWGVDDLSDDDYIMKAREIRDSEEFQNAQKIYCTH